VEAARRPGICLLTAMFNKITEDEKLPPVWSTSTTFPMWKNKGDVADCANYRPIRLLCHSMKIFERVLDARLRRIITTTPNQCGCVKGSGTSDAIHAVRIMIERQSEKNLTVHTSFLDLEKAFDWVPHDLIWHALRSHGVPETCERWVKMLYNNTTSVVRTPVGTSPLFPIRVGVFLANASCHQLQEQTQLWNDRLNLLRPES